MRLHRRRQLPVDVGVGRVRRLRQQRLRGAGVGIVGRALQRRLRGGDVDVGHVRRRLPVVVDGTVGGLARLRQLPAGVAGAGVGRAIRVALTSTAAGRASAAECVGWVGVGVASRW